MANVKTQTQGVSMHVEDPTIKVTLPGNLLGALSLTWGWMSGIENDLRIIRERLGGSEETHYPDDNAPANAIAIAKSCASKGQEISTLVQELFALVGDAKQPTDLRA